MSRHVAVLFEFPTLNGGERSMLAVLKRLSSVGSEFTFTALAPPAGLLSAELKRLGIRHLPFSVRNDFDRKRPVAELLTELHQLAERGNPDVIHANSLSMSRLLGQMGAAPTSFIRTGHLRDIIKLNRTVIGDLNNNQQLVAVSAATRKFHVDQGLQADTCRVIHNGVDTQQFQPRSRQELRLKLLPQISADSKVILNVGQICLRKAQPALAKSVCRLLADNIDLHLVIAGTRHSTKAESIEFERSILAEFQAVGREQNLHVLGHRDDVHHLMNAADLLVHVAHQEPFGRVLLEAAASELPIIATDVGGTSEMLGAAEACLIPPACPESLSASLTLLLRNSEQRNALAVSARKAIQAKFTIETAAANLADFWRSC